MTIEKADEGVDQTRNVLVGIRFDKESKELVGWALVKVAEPHDHVITVHVSRNSEEASKDKLLLDDYLGIYKGICDIKKVKLSGKVLVGKSIRKVLVKEAKECAAAAVIVGINKLSFSTWVSTAKYCAKHLSPTIEIFTVHNGKIVFQRTSSDDHLTGLGDPKPSFNKASKLTDTHSEFCDHEASEISSNSPKTTIRGSESTGSTETSGELVVVIGDKSPLSVATKVSPRRSISFNSSNVDSMMEQRPGWPLLRRPSLPTQRALDARKMSVVQWVMSLPDRSPPNTPQSSSNSSACSMSSKSEDRETTTSASSDGVFGRKSRSRLAWNELVEDPGLLFDSNASDFTWFSYEVLSHATSRFSSEKLIGKGGCSRVYKGVFMDGKQVAVKVMKSSKQSWKDFSLEVNIMSSLKHKNITPLLGVCIDNSELISVYGFMSKGSLEENLLVEKEPKTSMSWEARYRVAVGIAEALHYLHTGCSKSVIHRDVKSSNILLSDDFEPQLSDFGLAIWGPSSSSFETYTDVVGTFGYLAPEYFMYGKVSDRLDVYSFGVVLLELLSGRKPIDSSKGQESLVMWAKPILDSGKLKGLVDPNLEGKFDESQMQRMVVAAALCLTRAARLRPDMSQILKLLNGEEKVETWEKPRPLYEEQGDREEFDDNNDDDEVYKQSTNAKRTHLSLALHDIEDDYMSCSSVERSHNPSLEDYLKGRCSRSSSFD